MSHRFVVFFDLDGTLIDLNPDFVNLEQLRETMIQLALDAGVSLDNKSIFNIYQRLVIQLGFDHPISKRMRLILDAYETIWARYRSVTKYGVQHLDKLREREYIIGIVTSNGTACLQTLFDANKLQPKWFDFTVTRDTCPLLKPSPMPIKYAYDLAKELSPCISKIWFVGDSKQDEQAIEAFNHDTGLKITFIKIGVLQEIGQVQSYSCLDDFFSKELLKCL